MEAFEWRGSASVDCDKGHEPKVATALRWNSDKW